MRAEKRMPGMLPAFLMVVLFVGYIVMNWEKVEVMRIGFALYDFSNEKQTLTLKKGRQTLAVYDLPTSDFFDRSGQRQLNFRYLEKGELERLSQTMSNGEYWLNGDVLGNVQVQRYPHAMAIVLAEKKLYLLAPPHAEQFAYFIQQERKNRPDVMVCKGSKTFCQSVSIAALGAVSAIKDKILKEDTVGSFLAPMGRWVSNELDANIQSIQPQEVILTATMSVPFDQQRIKIKDPEDALYQIIKNGPRPIEDSRLPYMHLAPFIFRVKLPLKQGETILRVLFDRVSEDNANSPIPLFSGVLTRLEISPVVAVPSE